MSLTRAEIEAYVNEHMEVGNEYDVLKDDCDIIEFMLDNWEIAIPKENRFFAMVNCECMPSSMIRAQRRAERFKNLIEEQGLIDVQNAFACDGNYDFSHTTTEWESVISLGIFGLRSRINEYAQIHKGDAKKERFFDNIIRVYDAALRFMNRVAKIASECGKLEMAQSLINLSQRKPSNLYEALQTSIVYYTLQQFFDGTALRTLGRLDKLFYPFYKEEKSNADGLILDYIKEIDRFGVEANIPFAIGGTEADGGSLINELSYIIVDAYNKAGTNNTKFHLLCSDNTPIDIIKKAFCCVRDGNNSIVFMSDKKVIESLKKIGAEHSDAANYHIVGCYECGAEGELTCSCNARVNLPKALELAINGGRDMLTGKLIGLETESCFESFEELYVEFTRQVDYLCHCAMKATNLYEMNYKYMHSAPILSGVYKSALENGKDLYCDYGAKYNNSSVNALGLATVTDSLIAIKKLVFDDKKISIEQFADILKSNWDGEEVLRLTIKNKFPKYGNADAEPDNIAKSIVKNLANTISGKPNAKGGVYRLGLFSINWRWEFGENTAASADGRLSGETISQNTGASFGAERKGATEHLISVSRIDTSDTPNGAIVDIDLHSSGVKGENGINALVSTLKTYFDLGGFAVHYNILNTEVLRDAKENTDKYPNLQVRLCGWNVLFSSLSNKEKEEFIARSQK